MESRKNARFLDSINHPQSNTNIGKNLSEMIIPVSPAKATKNIETTNFLIKEPFLV